jgi:hypothetical protein
VILPQVAPLAARVDRVVIGSIRFLSTNPASGNDSLADIAASEMRIAT